MVPQLTTPLLPMKIFLLVFPIPVGTLQVKNMHAEGCNKQANLLAPIRQRGMWALPVRYNEAQNRVTWNNLGVMEWGRGMRVAMSNEGYVYTMNATVWQSWTRSIIGFLLAGVRCAARCNERRHYRGKHRHVHVANMQARDSELVILPRCINMKWSTLILQENT